MQIKEFDIAETGFRSRLGHYEYVIIFCGLTNALAEFMLLMNSLFCSFLGKFIFVFMNYVLIYSKKCKNTKYVLNKI